MQSRHVNANYAVVGHVLKSSDMYFVVPKYQRDYAWEQDQVDDFCDDLHTIATAKHSDTLSHFFGAIVLIEGKRVGERSECEVVDGQQRLTTFFLFIAALRDAFRALAESTRSKDVTKTATQAATQLENERLTFSRHVGGVYEQFDRMKPSGADREYFKALLDGVSMEPQRESHIRLSKAHSSLADMIARRKKGQPKAELVRLHTFVERLDTACHMLTLISSTQGVGYDLFSVLNDRGLTLSNGNLLRSDSLSLLEGHPAQQSTVEKIWDDVLSDPPGHTDDYIASYYSANRGQRASAKELFRDFRDAFLKRRPVRVTPTTARQLAKTLADFKSSVHTLRLLREGEWPYDQLAQPATEWDTSHLRVLVENLGHTNCMPLLLAARKLKQRHFSEIVRSIELFVFRYKSICNQHISSATRVYEKHAKKILDAPDTYQTKWLREDLQQLLDVKADDELFKTGLRAQLRYDTRGNRGLIKVFLILLDDYWEWVDKGARGFQKCMRNSRVLYVESTTIEHIYPQKADPAHRDRALEPLKHRIGNLTILAPNENSDEGNSPFSDKRNAYQTSVVLANVGLGRKKKWTDQAVQEREDQLFERATKVFRL